MAQAPALRIMTANVWGDYFGNPVAVREDQFMETFREYRPDVIGLQEMTPGWVESSLFQEMQEHYALVGTVLGSHVNYVPLAYSKERFDLLEGGFRRYSDTPDRSKAITYAVLTEKNGGQRLAVCNTHFWWKSGPEHDLIRKKNARELAACMKELSSRYGCAVFAFGDLNSTVSSEVFAVFGEEGVVRLYDLAEVRSEVSSHHGNPVLGEDGRYHGAQTERSQEHSIDHIVMLAGEEPCRVQTYQVILDQRVLDASDHSPVYADVVL